MTGRSKKSACAPPGRFLDPALLHQAAVEIGELAALEGVRVALIGGFAMQFYGSNRLTGDIDVAADRRIRALPRGEPLSFGGEQTMCPNGVPVDLVLRDDDYEGLYDEALEKTTRVRGLSIPIVRPEYLAAMKMVAGRGRDDVDLEYLIAAKAVDTAKARRVVREHLGPYAADELVRLVEEVTWKTSVGRR